ncbi:recombinase family protein [Agathobaculum sp.]|uniref:recombinase family protein n=1 Tax=Agathobaculum sp. TaxID=2048138 RepID=UPI003AB19DA3
MRVTFYARVSTDSDEQLNSLDNQIGYYRDYITRNPAWTFIDGYIDEGLSGMTTRKRDNFQRMVQDAKDDKFDLILTKEITRFARNTLDSIRYTRELLSAGVGVFFQNDNINTFDEDSELRLTIMSGIAQDELRKLSSRVRFGHQQAIKNNVVLGNSRIFGYRKDSRRLVIDENEAPMVRELFELYATDHYSMKQIENLFWEKGYRNHNDRKIAHTTMSGMISNPKYKGYYVGNKVRIVDMFTKKQKFLPPEEWVMFKDESGEIVPAIVSEELWDAANAVLTRRSRDVKRRQNLCNHDNLLTGKLYCTHCAAAYYRRDAKDRKGSVNSKWVCSGKIKNGKDSCPSLPLYEQELRPVLMDVFKEADVNADELIERYIEMYRAISQDDTGLGQEIDTQRTRRELAEKKKSKLLEYNVTGQITDADFLKMNRQCDNEIDECNLCLEELEAARTSRADLNAHIAEIRRVLQAARDDAVNGLINRDFVQKYIDRIFVTVDNDKIQLQIKLFTSESTMRYLEKLERRSGHTFKKMIESYEQSLAAKG